MNTQLNDHINIAIRENETIVTDWPLHTLAKDLYRWTDIFNSAFFKDHPVPVPAIRRFPCHQSVSGIPSPLNARCNTAYPATKAFICGFFYCMKP